MKQSKDFRGKGFGHSAEDSLKKAVKLAPIKKSGKEKRAFIHDLEEDDAELENYRKKESVLDYFDDPEEDL